MEPDLSVPLDASAPTAPQTATVWADRALEQLPYPVVILDGDLRLRLANAEARTRLASPPVEDDPAPGFETVLARSGAMSSDVRAHILSCCGAEVRGANALGKDGAVFPVSPGQAIALHARRLGDDRWMVVLEDRPVRDSDPSRTGQSERDPLTGIGDRAYFERKVTEALAGNEPGRFPSVLVLDVDRFRAVNDRLGRQCGDAILRAMAGRLRRATRGEDMIARLEGDTFAVLLNDGTAADKLAIRLVDLLGRPYLARGEVVTIGISLGAARAPADGKTARDLLASADMARREAKSMGGQCWRRHGQSMADRARARLDLETDLRRALVLGQMHLVYQPKVNLRTRTVTGFEALSRWTHPKRGPVPPGLFIPVAEDIGMIAPIGDWALRAACHDAVTWPEPLTVAVNVSARQLDNGSHFMTQLTAALRESGLPTRRLELEITETALTHHPDEARRVLRDVHELGVQIAMDDFGSGYSSLRQLRDYPFDTIKIDQSFIRSLDSSDDSGALVSAIATLGAGLGMTVVAEGVETLNQARMVAAHGCTDIQGYLISQPVLRAEIPTLLARPVPDFR